MPEIRQITFDNLMTDYAPLHRYAFYTSPPLDLSLYENQSSLYEDATVLGMYDDGDPVATVVSIPMTQNVRGKVLPMSGVAGVTSKPTARRKGYVKKLMQALFDHMHEQNLAVSMLYPFRESFYERLGYSLFTHIKSVKFKTADMKPLLSMELSGSVEYLNQAEGWRIAEAMLNESQQLTHGMGLFLPEPLKYLYGKDDHWLAVARDDDGEVIGVMAYKITAFWGTFEVSRFFVQNSLARYLLLQFIAKHVDQVHDVNLKRLPYDMHPETWFSDFSVKGDPEIWLTPMGRVVDIKQLSGIDVGNGDITLQINDPQCAWNNGIFRFSSVDGKLQIEPAQSPDATLTINGLSALIYGTHDLNDFQWRGWGTLSTEHIQILSKMFPKANPYLFALF